MANDKIVKLENLSIQQSLQDNGMTHDMVCKKLLDLFDHESIKIDKNGNVHSSLDGNLRLKAIELWAKIMGLVGPGNKKELHVHNHVSEEVLNELESATNGIVSGTEDSGS